MNAAIPSQLASSQRCLACALIVHRDRPPRKAPKGKLVLYTSQPERDAAQTVAAFKQARTRTSTSTCSAPAPPK